MMIHVERTGKFIRKQDEGKRVTFCGRLIGGIHVDPKDVVPEYLPKNPWMCAQCRMVNYYFKATSTDRSA